MKRKGGKLKSYRETIWGWKKNLPKMPKLAKTLKP
jgi:hypothetical protein